MSRTDHGAERLRRRAEHVLAEHHGLSSWKRQVLARFLVEGPRGWHVFLHRNLPRTPPQLPDALLIGPPGVLAVALRDQPLSPDDARRVFRHAADLFLGARARASNVSEAVVRPVLVLPAQHTARARTTPEHLTVTEAELDRVLYRGERRLDRRDAHTLAEHLRRRSDDYVTRTLDTPPHPAQQEGDGELFGSEEMLRDRFDRALSGPFESWLTFLDDSQFAMVRRRYSGPARISGPAGTGKSVVALHRLVHLAKRSTGQLLFTTYARNIPPIMRHGFGKLAPELLQRTRFTTLHSWAGELLKQRGVEFDVDQKTARHHCFSRAWSRVGRGGPLQELEPNPDYWWDEVDRVIKGRGIGGLDEYQRVERNGRGMGLARGSAREAMWRLYEEYERLRVERGVHDFNDLLRAALEQLRTDPLEQPYAAVVVDEVQDITLLGLRLLHLLAGDGPDGLLLVGDGQQQVYPGGWRLSDAGIPIRGRGEVLRENYRNCSRILDLAKQYDATNRVDDLDGDMGISLREAVATLRGGRAERWRGPRSEHEASLLAALRELDDFAWGDIAVLTPTGRDVAHWTNVLNRAGIPFLDLDRFDGEPADRVKVGTVHRAKGLEFRAVFVPELPDTDARQDRGRERREREQRAGLVALTRARDHLWVGFPQDA